MHKVHENISSEVETFWRSTTLTVQVIRQRAVFWLTFSTLKFAAWVGSWCYLMLNEETFSDPYMEPNWVAKTIILASLFGGAAAVVLFLGSLPVVRKAGKSLDTLSFSVSRLLNQGRAGEALEVTEYEIRQVECAVRRFSW